MSELQRTVVQSLLLSAPKERRLDLAIASVLSTVRKEYVEVVLLGQRQVVPVYFFFDEKRGYDVFFFSPELAISFPGQASKPAPASVPAFARNPEWAWQVEEFVFRSSVTCSRGELVVGVSNGAQTWEEHALVDTRLQKERETCRLLILATLRGYAPGLLPLLEAEGQKEEGRTENHPAAQTSLIQELVFVPVILPKKHFFEHCQYQVYDLRFGVWRSCGQEWDGDANACYPYQCPGCGSYYCEQHFSETKYTFLATKEERRFYGTVSVTKEVCLTCALLPEEEVKRLRATRLAINGEPEQLAQRMR